MVKVMERYMQEMWGGKEELPDIEITEKVPVEIMNKQLNKTLNITEVKRAIKKLKKNKAPGEDYIPNEVWMGLEEDGVATLTRLLEDCRKDKKFPKGWTATEIRWLLHDHSCFDTRPVESVRC